MAKQITAIKVSEGKREVVVFEDVIENIYALIGCRCVDILTRSVKGSNYLFIVDDEGALKEDNPITAVDVQGKEVLHGQFLVTREEDEYGELTSLESDDMEALIHSTFHGIFVYSTKLAVTSGVKGQA